MKIKYVLVVFTCLIHFVSCKSIAQNKQQKIEQLVSKLSWDSFTLDNTYGIQLKLNETSHELEKEGMKASKNLFDALYDSDKTVAAHMILTKIWESEVFFLTTPTCSEINDDGLDYSMYILNNLTWYRLDADSTWLLDEENKEIIISYWESRLNNPR